MCDLYVHQKCTDNIFSNFLKNLYFILFYIILYYFILSPCPCHGHDNEHKHQNKHEHGHEHFQDNVGT
jgi:hypothetical protein